MNIDILRFNQPATTADPLNLNLNVLLYFDYLTVSISQDFKIHSATICL